MSALQAMAIAIALSGSGLRMSTLRTLPRA